MTPQKKLGEGATAGRWTAEGRSVKCDIRHGGLIATCSWAPDTASAEANALLISKAPLIPELAEALRLLADGWHSRTGLPKALKMARAVLAKLS